MSEIPRIGVYVCKCGTNIGGVVDVEGVTERVAKVPHVEVARFSSHICSDNGQQMVKDDIRKYGLNRVVIASCSPRMHELTFRKTLKEAGLNPYLLEIANIREHCSWVHAHEPDKATAKALDLVRMAIAKVEHLEPLSTSSIEVEQAVLVIGGGISGIQSALDVADAGYKVVLVEKAPSIGGRMAQWGKVFPTLDCSQCILTPKMSAVGNHPNITLLVNSEVTDVRGSIGNFTVQITRRPSYVTDACTSCGKCAEKCPTKKIPDKYNEGLSRRTAIYKPFSQAIPNKYTIDPEHCLMITRGKCGICKKVCEAGAVDYDQKEEEITVRVGAIIVATGFDVFNAEEIPRLGFGLYPNVVTGPIFERMLSPFGPSEGEVYRPSDGKLPKSVAFILCVGSRDETLNITYCSRVCCMYTMKHARLLKETHPEVEVTIFYMDIRTFGKGYEEFYKSTQALGVNFVRGRVAEVQQDFATKNLILSYEDTLLGRTMASTFEMVVLAVGQKPNPGAKQVQGVLNIPAGLDGFFLEAHPKLRPNDTPVDGIYLAGSCQYPKDIADAVAQASGAAARALIPVSSGRVETEALLAKVDPERCSACRVCEATCQFYAIEVKRAPDHRLRAVVNETLCKGCGACAAACPVNAITASGFSDHQMLSQLRAALGEPTGRELEVAHAVAATQTGEDAGGCAE